MVGRRERPREWYEAFGVRLRLALGATPRASIAEHMGVTPSTVSRWMAGDAAPDPDQMARLAVVLGCSSDYLLGIERPDLAQEQAAAALALLRDLAAGDDERAQKRQRVIEWLELRARAGTCTAQGQPVELVPLKTK